MLLVVGRQSPADSIGVAMHAVLHVAGTVRRKPVAVVESRVFGHHANVPLAEVGRPVFGIGRLDGFWNSELAAGLGEPVERLVVNVPPGVLAEEHAVARRRALRTRCVAVR